MDNSIPKPTIKPANIKFGSGPCRKHPGWAPTSIDTHLLGRSHRSVEGVELIKNVIETTRSILGIPADYKIAIVPGSSTGAIEMGMWNLLGCRPIDVVAFDVFGERWHQDLITNLKLTNVHAHEAPFGELPDLSKINRAHDVVFTWNGTTSGVKIPNADWIASDHAGLTFCDATSAAFGMELPWQKLDVTSFSWQKCLGGEGGHGVIVLSPKAIERLEEYTPNWPIPWLLSMKNNGKINYGMFEGKTINTPSMMCVIDVMDALNWLNEIGGLKEAVRRTNENFSIVDKWVNERDWVSFTARDHVCRSTTSVCLQLNDTEFNKLNFTNQWEKINQICNTLKVENIALDIKNHALSKPGFRIWCGPTVESADVAALLPWLEWAYVNHIS